MVDPLSLANGARFYRCALQVNPSHYAQTFRGQDSGLDERAYIEEVLEACRQLGIEVVAVTDHNHAGSVDGFRAAGRECGVHVFPGFEVASKDGIHILCLYEPDTPTSKLDRYLGSLGIQETSPSASLSDKAFDQILQLVKDQGGITVAAHVTESKGLLCALHGEARVTAWRDPNLLAIQIPGAIDGTPADKRPIIRNENPDYRRACGVGEKQAVAVVNAKDVASASDLHDSSASCLIKMSQVSVEGLRQAFLDPLSRIRIAGDPEPEEHSEIVGLAWEGGFLDGCGVHLNSNLNVFIGGRGTGKSTVIESIRYALALAPICDGAKRTSDGIVKNVLGSGTKIRVIVRSHRPRPERYTVERIAPNPPVVLDGDGRRVELSPLDVLPGIEVYGQHEISELTGDPEKLTRLLKRFVGASQTSESKRASLARLRESRAKMEALQAHIRQADESLVSQPALLETLKRYESAGLEERLLERSLLVKEEALLGAGEREVEQVGEAVGALRALLPVECAGLRPDETADLPNAVLLTVANDALDELSSKLSGLTTSAEDAVAAARTALAEARRRWDVCKESTDAAYQKSLRELQKDHVDGEEFIRLRRKVEELKPVDQRRAEQRKELDGLAVARKELLRDWQDARAAEFRELEAAAKKVSRRLHSRVRVTVRYEGERAPLADLLREEVGGRLQESIDALGKVEPLSLVALAEACRNGGEALAATFGIPVAQAEKIALAAETLAPKIEELDLRHTTNVELNTAAYGDPAEWHSLEDLSTGQKATAVLLLLLLESDAPLIIDQPEDDLDNRFITEGIVPRMRDEKRRRQFIFSTHNANIPVLGDAELIVGLEAAPAGAEGALRMPAGNVGSIDAPQVRHMVEEVLEGGKAAFETRRMKYGF